MLNGAFPLLLIALPALVSVVRASPYEPATTAEATARSLALREEALAAISGATGAAFACGSAPMPAPPRPPGYLERCLKNPEIRDGVWVNVRDSDRRDCAKGGPGYDIRPYHAVRRVNGRLEVRLRVDFVARGDAAAIDLAEFRRALNCAKGVYRRNGLELVVETKAEHGVRPDVTVEVWSRHAQSRSTLWQFNSTEGDLTPESRCGVYAHEMGHLLGLPDEWPDPSCRSRRPGNPKSLMYGDARHPPSAFFLNEAHLRGIVGPLCDDPSSTHSMLERVRDRLGVDE